MIDYPTTSITLIKKMSQNDEYGTKERFRRVYDASIWNAIKDICGKKRKRGWLKKKLLNKIRTDRTAPYFDEFWGEVQYSLDNLRENGDGNDNDETPNGECTDVDECTQRSCTYVSNPSDTKKKKNLKPKCNRDDFFLEVFARVFLTMAHELQKGDNKGKKNIDCAVEAKELALQEGETRTFRGYLYNWVIESVIIELKEKYYEFKSKCEVHRLDGQTISCDSKFDTDVRSYAERHGVAVEEGSRDLACQRSSYREKINDKDSPASKSTKKQIVHKSSGTTLKEMLSVTSEEKTECCRYLADSYMKEFTKLTVFDKIVHKRGTDGVEFIRTCFQWGISGRELGSKYKMSQPTADKLRNEIEQAWSKYMHPFIRNLAKSEEALDLITEDEGRALLCEMIKGHPLWEKMKKSNWVSR